MKLALELEFPDDQAASVIRALQTLAASGVICDILPTNATVKPQLATHKSM